jgi:hypothetical protein
MIMSKLVKMFCTFGIILVASATMSQLAAAPSVELAKKCRVMMLDAYPPPAIGSDVTRDVQKGLLEARQYFQTCVARGGKMDNSAGSTVGRGSGN